MDEQKSNLSDKFKLNPTYYIKFVVKVSKNIVNVTFLVKRNAKAKYFFQNILLIESFIINVGGKDLSFYVRPQAPITNKSMFEENKTFGKAP